MQGRRRIEDRVRKKEEEIRELEMKIREARAYVQALQEAIRVFSREHPDRPPAETLLRPGSAVAQARDAIIRAGKPLHILEILEATGREKTRASRAALGGSISAYVRRREVFTRPKPNTFGLSELGHNGTIESEPDLPANFGDDSTHADSDDEIPF